MKLKTLFVTMITIVSTSISVFADNLPTNDYLSMLNTNLAEMNAELDGDQNYIKMVLKYGIDEYIDTTIKKDTELRDALVDLTSNMQDIKTMNMTLNDKHYNFMKELNELSSMLNDLVKIKEDAKNKNNIKKVYTVLVDETKQTNKMNKQIAKINYLYREINSFKK